MSESRYVIWWWWTNGTGPVIEPDEDSVRVFGVADGDLDDVVYGPVDQGRDPALPPVEPRPWPRLGPPGRQERGVGLLNSTSTCCWSERSSTLASARNVRLSAGASGGPKKLRGHSRRLTTTLTSAL